MDDVVGNCPGHEVRANFFRESSSIVVIWATNDVDAVNACIMPVGFSVRYHGPLVVDFKTESLLINSPPSIVRPVL